MSLYIYLAVLISCLATGFYYRKILSQGLRLLLWLVLIAAIVEIVGTYHLRFLFITASLIYRIYQPIEYVLLAGYFFTIITSPAKRKLIILSIPVVVLVNLLNLFANQYQSLGLYAFLLAALLFVIWSIFYFFQLFKSNDGENPAHIPAFWICTGILFFYAGTFFQMGFTNMIYKHNPDLAKKLYVINHLLNCVLYGMITYGFICQSKYRKL